LTDRRFFLAVCRACHFNIHNNPRRAQELGLIAPPGQWNKPER
jgi:hypothetical protein